jgi:flavine halogenase
MFSLLYLSIIIITFFKDTDFIALGHNNNAWNVIRSEFDQILLNHSRDCGASVHELTRVDSIQFSHTDPSRPISATWTHSPSQQKVTGTTEFTYLIDASGRAGILSTAYLKNRHFNASLKNIAVWAYWKGVGTYGLGTTRQGAPWFEALTGNFPSAYVSIVLNGNI